MTHATNSTANPSSGKVCEYMIKRMDGVFCTVGRTNPDNAPRCPHAYYCKECGKAWRLLKSKVIQCETRREENKRNGR